MSKSSRISLPPQSFTGHCNNKTSESSRPSEVEDNSQLYVFLNTLIFQYLEILGLGQTYSSFRTECMEVGYPLPENLTKVDIDCGSESTSFLRLKDVEQLIKYFDEEDSDAIIKIWDHILLKCLPESKMEAFRLNFQLRIYVYITVPYKQGRSDDHKQINIQRLIDEFKSKDHDDVDDSEMLSIFALPFVHDPVNHPVFSKFFTKAWIQSLRKSLKTFSLSLCRKLPNPFLTDIGKMYRLWSNTSSVMQEFSVPQIFYGQTTSDSLRLQSNPSVLKQCKFPKESNFRMFFETILTLRKENEKLRENEQSIKSDHMQKIQLCDALVNCLHELYTNKEGNETVWKQVFDAYSDAKESILPESTKRNLTIIESSRKSKNNNPFSEHFPIEHHNHHSSSSRNSNRDSQQRRKHQRSNKQEYKNEHINSNDNSTLILREIREITKSSRTGENNATSTDSIYEPVYFRATERIEPLPPPPFVDNARNSRNFLSGMQTNRLLYELVQESAKIEEAK